MWIRWKYLDSELAQFSDLEIPDNWGGYESVVEYLYHNADLHIPVWSDQFSISRIKWEKLELPEAEIKARKILNLRKSIIYHKEKIESASNELNRLLAS